MHADACSHHPPRALEINSYNQEVSRKVGSFIIFLKNRLSRSRILNYTTIMFVIFIYIKSRDKVSSAQSKGAQTTFRLSTFAVVVDLASPSPSIGGEGGCSTFVSQMTRIFICRNYFLKKVFLIEFPLFPSKSIFERVPHKNYLTNYILSLY